MTRPAESSSDCRPSASAVWLPWIVAPLFCLLPMGGCVAANAVRQSAGTIAKAITADPPLVAIGMTP
ncbi:MAG: hypothetical protein ACKOYJ_09975 [Planctomycetia bacterium]